MAPRTTAQTEEFELVAELADKRLTLYLDRCVHCARCAEVCPKDSIYLDEEFAMAAFSREALKIVME